MSPTERLSIESLTDSTRRTVLKLAVGVGAVSTFGSTPAAADEPIEIEDWDDLNEIRNDLESEYVLTADLDKDTAGYNEHVDNPEGGWKPIDPDRIDFFDGNDHTIADLVIDRPDEDGIGLFRIFYGNMTIQNLHLENIDITANGTFSDPVGGLAGKSDGDCVIENISVSGTVTATEGNRVGLLVGDTFNTDLIKDCETSGSVSGSRRVGGLVGRLDGDDTDNDGAVIENCNSSAEVTTIEDPAESTGEFGGLVGDVQPGALVQDSFATGDVSGNDDAGGLAGQVLGRVRRCYASGEVTSNGSAGGLADNLSGNDDEAIIEQSYAVGSVPFEGSTGGLVNSVSDGATVRNSYAAVAGELGGGLVHFTVGENIEIIDSYWDETVSGVSESDGGVGLETTDMQGETAENTMPELDYVDTWQTVVENADINTVTPDGDGYPILATIDTKTQLDAQSKSSEPDGPADFSVEITSPTDSEEVTENEALDVDVVVANTGGEVAEKTIELTSPIEDDVNVELDGGETAAVQFEIPSDEIVGNVQITVESPNDTDQVTVTAVDPCFIATAAYDTPAADEIDVLRDFRDDVLRQHVLGRLFVKTYYRSSPPIAQWIRRNRTRRELVKQYFVEPLVDVVQTRRSIWKRE